MIGFVVNPAAGRGRGVNLIKEVEAALRERNIGYIVKFSKYEGHAAELVKELSYDGCENIVAVGGDGTVLECAQGMYFLTDEQRENISLGILACGSGNDFARNLNLPKNMDDALEIIIGKNTMRCDMFECNGIPGLNIACMGIDSEIAYLAGRIKKIFGKFSYIAAVIKTIFTYKSIHAKINMDGEIIEGDFTILAMCNGKYYGGGFMIAPMADITDDLITFVYIDHLPWYKMLVLFPRVLSGGHVGLKEVHVKNCRRVEIEYNSGNVFNIDGNIVDVGHVLKFSVKHFAINIIHNI